MTTVPPITISLDQLRVASPCSANWEDMSGDGRKRLCAECGLHVHNIAGMTTEEAKEFLQTSAAEIAKGSRVCVRFYRRGDGTILTKNCPVGLAAMRRRAWAGMRRVAAAVALCVVGVFVGRRAMAESQARTSGAYVADSSCRAIRPFSWISAKLGKQRVVQTRQIMMGAIYIPPPPTLPQHVQNVTGLPINGEAR